MTESIREQIAQLIRDYTNQQIAIVVNATIPKKPLTSDGQADQILSLPEIAVLDEKQELPEQDILGIIIASHIPAGMKVKLIDDVIKSHGWKKCIK